MPDDVVILPGGPRPATPADRSFRPWRTELSANPGYLTAPPVLMAGLTEAGLYDLSPEDDTTVRALAERLDEAAVRRVAHWLTTAGGAR